MATTPCYTGEILTMYSVCFTTGEAVHSDTAMFDSMYNLFRQDSGHALPTVRSDKAALPESVGLRSFDTPEEAMIMCKHKEGYHEGLRMYIFAKNGKYCATYSPTPAPRIGYRMVGSKLV